MIKMKDGILKNRKMVPLLAAAAVLLSALAAGISIYNSPMQRLKRQLQLADKYLTEENYEQAVLEFMEAVAIDPKSEDAISGLENACIAHAQVLNADGSMESHIKAYKVLMEGYAQTGRKSLHNTLYTSTSGVFRLKGEGPDVYIPDAQRQEWCRQWVDAIEPYKSRFPDEWQCWQYLDHLYYGLGEYELCAQIRQELYELTGSKYYEADAEVTDTFDNGDTHTCVYDKYGRSVSSVYHYAVGGYDNINDECEYREDGKKIQMRIAEVGQFTNSEIATYEYDAEGRILRQTDFCDSGEIYIRAYTYTEQGFTVHYSYTYPEGSEGGFDQDYVLDEWGDATLAGERYNEYRGQG